MYNLTINGTKLTRPNLLPSKRDNYEWVIVVATVHSKVFTAFADNAAFISTHLINSRAHISSSRSRADV